MALIVEDGTGLTNSESYASVAEFKAYADKVGYDYTSPSYTDTQIEQALRRSTVWLDAEYKDRYQGTWTVLKQALEWPRTGVTYRGESVDAYSIPQSLKDALCEVAWRELVTPSIMTPDAIGANIKRDRVGDTETEFFSLQVGSRPSIANVDNLLSGLLKAAAFAYVGKAVRG